MLSAFKYCEDLVRDGDKDHFLATLFAPAGQRGALHALYAFDLEVARIGENAREPMAGAIRLQWWREVIAGLRPQEASGHPVAAALCDVMRRHALPPHLFETLIEARRHDAAGEPIVRIEEFETYARDTAATLVELAARILVPAGAASDFAFAAPTGSSIGITQVLRALGFHAARGDLLLPGELLARHGVEPHDVLAGKPGAGLAAAVAELRARAAVHYDAARELIAQAPPAATPAWLAVALVPAFLKALDRNREAPFAIAEVPQWRRQWILWRAARAGGLA
jgi:15-cis-phytoene synthase